MYMENHWGAPRIHGELLKLGFEVCEATVSNYLKQFDWKKEDRKGQSWATFLRNHLKGTISMDFIVVPTVRFQLLYVLVILAHHRRKLLHLNVTFHPTSAWIKQQLREALPFEHRYQYLIRDRDAKFGKTENMIWVYQDTNR